MISAWQKQQRSHPETADIVQKGIDKLESYRDRVQDVPVYILSMREFILDVLCHTQGVSSYQPCSQAAVV
jgi:hypothetical protein